VTNTRNKIAARLEDHFVRYGFTEPGVDALREASGVSLRTLYKYFPSREAMIIGALDHRHRTYLSFLEEESAKATGRRAMLRLFRRVGEWMETNAPQGCLFVNALAAYPSCAAIQTTLEKHKQETKAMIANRLGSLDSSGSLADQIMVLHEGLTVHAVTVGSKNATEAALGVVRSLLPKEKG